MKIVRGNACDLEKIHQKSGFGKVGYIICCLPFVSLPNEVGEKILSRNRQIYGAGLCVSHVSIRSRLLHAVGHKAARVYAQALRQIEAKQIDRKKRSAGLHADLENELDSRFNFKFQISNYESI